MKTTYNLKFGVTLTVKKGGAAVADSYTADGVIERDECNDLSPDQHVQLAGFEALASAAKGTEDDPFGVDAIKHAAKAVVDAMNSNKRGGCPDCEYDAAKR
jgi:hypothetical protein